MPPKKDVNAGDFKEVLKESFEQYNDDIKEHMDRLNIEMLAKIEDLNTKLTILTKKNKITETTKITQTPKINSVGGAKKKSTNYYTLFQKKFRDDEAFAANISKEFKDVIDNNKDIAEIKTQAKRNQKVGTLIWNLLKKEEHKKLLEKTKERLEVKEEKEEVDDQEIEENTDIDEPTTDKPSRD